MSLRDELERIKRRRRNVRPDEMHRLLRRAGFERRHGKGDHWIYSHPNLGYRLSIDPRNPLLPVYVSHAIRAIEEAHGDEAEADD